MPEILANATSGKMAQDMSKSIKEYFLPEHPNPKELMNCFKPIGKIHVEPMIHVQRIYLDTFDWRLYSKGSLLIEEQRPSETLTLWMKLSDNSLHGQFMTGAPKFVWNLPKSSLRDRLEAIVEMRVLLPVVQVKLQSTCFCLLNKHSKTILRLILKEGYVFHSSESYKTLKPRLCIEAIKGYRKPLQCGLMIINESLQLESAENLFDEALELVGKQAQGYSSKLNIKLEPEMPIGEALRQILLQLLDTMEINYDGTRANLDSEFLHDFRVALRRTRSIFSQFKGVLPKAILKRYRPEFKWLGKITGPTRDLDVYLLKFPGYKDSLPITLQAGLEPLQLFLQKRQKSEQGELSKQLASIRYSSLMREWRAFLESGFDPSKWPEKASKPVWEIASRRTWKTYKEVLQEGETINDDTPATALHELRIKSKKLRYLMEFFQSLYPEDQVRQQISVLKSLQNNLGDFQDFEVQAKAINNFAHAMQAGQSSLPRETFIAIEVLIDSLHQHQKIVRKNFSGRFSRFSRPENRRICEKLFKN